jgi:hypothetical protein
MARRIDLVGLLASFGAPLKRSPFPGIARASRFPADDARQRTI